MEAFQELLCLQQSRGGETEAQAKAEAEAHKLLGNVYVALQDNRSAEQHFTDALHLYAEAGGSSGKAAADMQHRIDRLAVSAVPELFRPIIRLLSCVLLCLCECLTMASSSPIAWKINLLPEHSGTSALTLQIDHRLPMIFSPYLGSVPCLLTICVTKCPSRRTRKPFPWSDEGC